MTNIALKIALLLLLGGCAVGPRIDQMISPQKPHGANVIVEIKQPNKRARLEHQGELIEVRDDGIVLLVATDAGGRLTFASWHDIDRVKATEFRGFQSTRGAGNKPLTGRVGRMRIISRYPLGLSENLMGQLLAFYEQQEFDRIERKR